MTAYLGTYLICTQTCAGEVKLRQKHRVAVRSFLISLLQEEQTEASPFYNKTLTDSSCKAASVQLQQSRRTMCLVHIRMFTEGRQTLLVRQIPRAL